MDILSHPERIDTSRQTHPRDALDCGSVHCSSDGERGSWTAVGKHTDGHGWDIDVKRDGKLVAMRVAAYAPRDAGIDIVSDTMHDVIEGRAIGNTYFL